MVKNVSAKSKVFGSWWNYYSTTQEEREALPSMMLQHKMLLRGWLTAAPDCKKHLWFLKISLHMCFSVKAKGQLAGVSSLPPPWDPGDRTRAVGLGDRHFYLPSLLPGPWLHFCLDFLLSCQSLLSKHSLLQPYTVYNSPECSHLCSNTVITCGRGSISRNGAR